MVVRFELCVNDRSCRTVTDGLTDISTVTRAADVLNNFSPRGEEITNVCSVRALSLSAGREGTSKGATEANRLFFCLKRHGNKNKTQTANKIK